MPATAPPATSTRQGTTIDHFDTPTNYMWGISMQRQLSPNWAFTAEYLGVKGVHLLTNVWNWSLNNVPLQLLPAWNAPQRPGAESLLRTVAELLRAAHGFAQPVAGSLAAVRRKHLHHPRPGHVGQIVLQLRELPDPVAQLSTAWNCWRPSRFGKPSPIPAALTFTCSARRPARCRIRTT